MQNGPQAEKKNVLVPKEKTTRVVQVGNRASQRDEIVQAKGHGEQIF